MYSYLKRAASAFLAAAMVLALLPAHALAVEAEEDGIPSGRVEEKFPGENPAEEREFPPETDSPAEIPSETSGDDIPETGDSPAVLYADVTSGTCGENLTWTLDEEGVLTISGTGAMKAPSAWSLNEEIRKVVIEYGASSVDSDAFEGCSSLISVIIPESVTSIGSFAFSGCKGLTSAGPIGGNYDYQFGWKTAIPEKAFSGCSGLTSVTIPESVTSIGRYAFSGCSDLASLTIPESVTSIGGSAFFGCTSLTSAGPIGGNYDYQFGWTTDIPGSAFYDCSGLTSVTIPEGVTSIGSYAFFGCTGLTSVIIPESVTSIENYVFSGCTGLTSVIIPEGVTSIGSYAFRDCTGLTSVTIPESVTSIENYAFSGCTDLTSAGPIGGNYDYQFGWKTAIPDYAFFGCSGLTSVTIPEGITSIGSYAFWHCGGLAGVAIPEGVTSIGYLTFCGCSGLTSVTIPESVTSIGDSAFWNCSGLTSVTIPEGVTSIGAYAFDGCTGLTNAGPIGGNYDYQFGWETAIPGNAFYGCSGLTSVTIPESVTFIGDSAFRNCSGLTSVTIPEVATSIEKDAFSGCSGLTSLTIPEGVTSIGSGAFCDCSGLTSVTIPESVTSIGWWTFHGCSGLTSVTIPESVTSINSDAFQNCSPDLCIYCYPGSYAESYAIENNLNYALLNRGDNEVFTWLATSVPNGVIAGTEFVIRAGYSALNAATLQITLPEGVTLSKSGVWLDGKELTADKYTNENGTLTVSLASLPDKPAHTLHLYCAATAAGSYSISGRLAMINGETHSLGTAVIQAEQARLNVPEKVGYTRGIVATGKTAPNCGVTLFVDGKEAGSTNSNDVGSWQISFDLNADVESGSEHTVYAKIQLTNDETVNTASSMVIYQACAVNPLKATMYNTGDHGAQETVFDFKKPEDANLIRYYRIWPSRYPSFTFKVEFTGDPSTLDTVSIVTVNSAGAETEIPAVYDPPSQSWVGTRNYTDFQDAPVWVGVVYTAGRICSNRLSAVPIMDPSGYVYEAVPSNRLAGVTAIIACQEENAETAWNAKAYDQINPQITGADGSYYWDVPAGNWRVSFTKEGYENTATEWLTVPPPQVDINVPMVSTAAPEVKCAAVYEDYAEITFSQYMDISSVQGAISLNGSAATVEALDAEDNTKGTQYATRFKATASGLSGNGNVELTVSTIAKNYAGKSLAALYSESCSAEVRPTEITAPKAVTMEMSTMQNVNITLVPNIPDRELIIENLTPAIISVREMAAVTGSNGGAEIPVEALLPGTGILRVSEPVSGLETTISIQVDATVKPEPSITASIENGILTYSVQEVSEDVSAKLIIVSYEGQRMSKAVILESTSGTWKLPDASASSYFLFLVESGTWKPLCPKYPVP